MTTLHEYTVELGGIPHTLLLDHEHAKRMGLTGAHRKHGDTDTKTDTKAAAPANKARSADNK